MATPILEIVAVNRPILGEDVSGDAWLHMSYPWGSRIILVDGAGHGPTAAIAATKALENLREASTGPEQIFQSCHEALLHTRGAVLSYVDITDDSLTFAGVGNVDGRLITRDRTTRFMPDRGLLGATLPRVRPMKLALTEDEWFVVLHSDGFSTQLKLEWQALLDAEARAKLLDEALLQWGRVHDDATLVLISKAKQPQER